MCVVKVIGYRRRQNALLQFRCIRNSLFTLCFFFLKFGVVPLGRHFRCGERWLGPTEQNIKFTEGTSRMYFKLVST